MKEQIEVVCIVDDDQAVRDMIADLVRDMGMRAKVFASAEEFLGNFQPEEANCLIVDVRMPGMSGIELLRKLAEDNMAVPTIVVTGHGDIPMTVEALKIGAIDFMEKPFREQTLWDTIKKAVASGDKSPDVRRTKAELEQKLSLLTAREFDVMKMLLAGNLDKEVAPQLDMSRRTVAHHRKNILQKTDVGSTVELAGLMGRLGITV